MSTATHHHIPELTLGWRLKMSLAYGHIKAEEMAERLEVSRQTVSRWMADSGTPPKRVYLDEWARVTGVPLEWLAMGVVPADPDGGGAAGRGRNALAELTAKKAARANRSVTRQYASAA